FRYYGELVALAANEPPPASVSAPQTLALLVVGLALAGLRQRRDGAFDAQASTCPSTYDATEKKTIKPTASAMDVMRGPLATAGAKRRLIRGKGRSTPIRLVTSSIRIIVTITTRPSASPSSAPPRNQPRMNPRAPRVGPIARPSSVSFPATLSHSSPLTSPVLNARIIVVADCDPALPPVSMIYGMKKASAMTLASRFS